MKCFNVVISNFSTKSHPYIVSGSWIYPPKDKFSFGERRYTYYHSDRNCQPPSTNMMFNLIREVAKDNNEEGYYYPACILAKFGKKALL